MIMTKPLSMFKRARCYSNLFRSARRNAYDIMLYDNMTTEAIGEYNEKITTMQFFNCLRFPNSLLDSDQYIYNGNFRLKNINAISDNIFEIARIQQSYWNDERNAF